MNSTVGRLTVCQAVVDDRYLRIPADVVRVERYRMGRFVIAHQAGIATTSMAAIAARRRAAVIARVLPPCACRHRSARAST
jgi:hypothetical protein